MKELSNAGTMKINGGTTDAGSGGGSNYIEGFPTRELVRQLISK